MSKFPYLKWTEQDRKDLLGDYGRTPQSVQEDVKSIQDWMQQQPHLKKYQLRDSVIENMLVATKFRMEVAKAKIDMYFSIRPYFPDFYKKMDAKSVQSAFDCVDVYCIPALTKDRTRIFLFKYHNLDPKSFDLDKTMAMILKLLELKFVYDYAFPNCYVFDCSGLSMAHLAQFTPIRVKNLLTVLAKTHTTRLTAVHLINAPPSVEKVVSLVKMFVHKKIANRIMAYPDSKILHEIVPKDEVPEDYGGLGPSAREIIGAAMKKLEELEPWIEFLNENPVDEALRPGKSLDYQLYGVEGNFRKLNVD